MSGPQLTQRLAVMCPRLKVVYISGYTDEAIVDHGVLAPGIRFIAKPFDPPELLALVRAMLDSD